MLPKEYIAGFFDGEGSIGVYKAIKHGNERYSLRTQLAQNYSKLSFQIFEQLVGTYGGAISRQDKKMNWQLGSEAAVKFLIDIEPHLLLKKSQAQIASSWQLQRPKRFRNERGQIQLKSEVDLEFDRKVCELMKLLKKDDIDVVMENQKSLISIVHTLKAVLCCKGG